MVVFEGPLKPWTKAQTQDLKMSNNRSKREVENIDQMHRCGLRMCLHDLSIKTNIIIMRSN